MKNNKFAEEKVVEIDNKSMTLIWKNQCGLKKTQKNLIKFPKHLFMKTSLSNPSGLII
ncbi:MAG: hypothetical protein L6276_01350 [Acetobacterium sp.]|nr:hypothetical protein [Acetobacterium sp.]